MNFFTIDKRYVIIYFLNFKNSKRKREEESVSSNSSLQMLVQRHYISERKLIRCQYVSPVEPVYIDTRVYDLQSWVANSTQWLHDVLATYVFSDWALFGLAANTDLANMTRNEGHFNGSWKQLFALGGTFSNVPLLKAYSISPGWNALLIFDFKKIVIFLIKIKESMDTFFPVTKSWGKKFAYINYTAEEIKWNIWQAIISLERILAAILRFKQNFKTFTRGILREKIQ